MSGRTADFAELARAKALLGAKLADWRAPAAEVAAAREVVERLLGATPESSAQATADADDGVEQRNLERAQDLHAALRASAASRYAPQGGLARRAEQKRAQVERFTDAVARRKLPWAQVFRDAASGLPLVVVENPFSTRVVQAILRGLPEWVIEHSADDELLRLAPAKLLQRYIGQRRDLVLALRIAQPLSGDSNASTYAIPQAQVTRLVDLHTRLVPKIGRTIGCDEAICAEQLYGLRLDPFNRAVLALYPLVRFALRFAGPQGPAYAPSTLSHFYGGETRTWDEALAWAVHVVQQPGLMCSLLEAREAQRKNTALPRDAVHAGAKLIGQLLRAQEEARDTRGQLRNPPSTDRRTNRDAGTVAELDAYAGARIAGFAPSLQWMTRQLLRERIEARFTPWLTDPAGLKALGLTGIQPDAPIEFVPGRLVRDPDGRQFTDGLIVQRKGASATVHTAFQIITLRSIAKPDVPAGCSKSALPVSLRGELRVEAVDLAKGLADRKQLDAAIVAKPLPTIEEDILPNVAKSRLQIDGEIFNEMRRAEEIYISGELTKVRFASQAWLVVSADTPKAEFEAKTPESLSAFEQIERIQLSERRHELDEDVLRSIQVTGPTRRPGARLTTTPQSPDPAPAPEPCTASLAGVDSTDYRSYVRPQTLGTVTPLINGCSSGGTADDIRVTEPLDAMQMAVSTLGRGDFIYLSAWLFMPATPLTALTDLELEDWGGLLQKKAGEGVKIRIIVSDFDPIYPMHKENHAQLDRLDELIAQLAADKQDNLKYIMSLHPARYSPQRFAAICQLMNISRPPREARPGSHHQKFMVVKQGEQMLAFCGGLDLDWRKTPEGWSYTWTVETPVIGWHDIHTKLEGPITRDLEREFVMRWNRENGDSTRSLLPRWSPFESLSMTPLSESDNTLAKKQHRVQMLRTVSTNAIVGAYRTWRDDIRQMYRNLIGCANAYIYMENQYFRCPEVADWIVERARGNTDLVVIMVVIEDPGVDDPDNPLAMHSAYLQYETFRRISEFMSARIGIYTMTGRSVHSKFLAVDDRFMAIGSANATVRSFELDSELNVSVEDPALVARFRRRLWSHNLGTSESTVGSWRGIAMLDEWDSTAIRNLGVPREDMAGEGVIPFDYTARPGRRLMQLLFDPDPISDVDVGPESERLVIRRSGPFGEPEAAG